MRDTKSAITEALERSFAERGFAEPGVAELRERAGVSIRTLYKHFPSREAMILAALEHRHRHYLAFLFPKGKTVGLDEVLTRVGQWMAGEASTGCLFQGAVAAHPDNRELKALLQRHKSEVAMRLAACACANGAALPLLLIHEGLVQTWPLQGDAAVAAAQDLAARVALAL